MCSRSAPIPPVTLGSSQAVTAAAAGKLIPDGAWQRLRTGSGTKGVRHYDRAMLEVTADDTPDGQDRRHSLLLIRRHRYTGTVSFYRCWTPKPVPLSRLIAVAQTRWRIEEDHQLAKQVAGLDSGQVIRWKSWHRWSALCLLAYIYIAVTASRAAGTDPGQRPRTDPPDHPRAAAPAARGGHPAASPRPCPPSALVHLAKTPPVPGPVD